MDLHVSKSTQDSLGFFNATPLGQQQNGSKLSLSLLNVAGNPTVSKHFSIPASAPGHDCEINLEGRKLNECFITRVCPPSMRGPSQSQCVSHLYKPQQHRR